jgi:hypothetical protein
MKDLSKHEKAIPSFRLIPAISVAVGELCGQKEERRNLISVKEMEERMGKSFKFWNKDSNPVFYYPNFLITGGHFFKKDRAYLDQFQLFQKDRKEQLIIGDSGGHQIAVGTIKFSPEIRDKILDFLEENSNYGVQLDLPTHKDAPYTFDYALENSLANIKYFHENRRGHTDFINILQGRSEKEIRSWYDAVAKYEFEGWSVASFDNSISKLMLKIAILLENKAFNNLDFKLLHVLGTSRLNFMPLLYTIQEEIRKINPGMTLSIDSSTPTRLRINGNLLEGFNRSARGLTLKTISVTKNWEEHLKKESNLDAPFYVRSPIVNALKIRMRDVFELDSNWNQYEWSPYHNTYVLIDIKHYIDRIMFTGSSEIMNDAIHPKLSLFVDIIREIFNSSSPMKVYYKYKHILGSESAFNGSEGGTERNTNLQEIF